MAHKQKKMLGLMFGSLGIVFGDIGTSPLYALKVVFGMSGDSSALPASTVYGVISLLLWTITLIVSIKYIAFIMRADNKGEGGIMALVSLIADSNVRYRKYLLVLGLVGVALFYGDSVVTPAISVLSAVEGLHVVAPTLASLIIPITLVVLTGLFWLQRYGTATIGKLFGPVMFIWFLAIGTAGVWRITQAPNILRAISPLEASGYVVGHPVAALVAMGAIVLAITGAEALYADMGHFGRVPISRTWFIMVFPALALCYLGQGALLLRSGGRLANPFYELFPNWLQLPAIILATAATLIASQAVISGAFSLTRQAMQLNFLPRLLIKQTSTTFIGQIYVPFVNFLLLSMVAILVVTFGSSEHLAGAYGVAVSGTLAIDCILFSATMYYFWRRSRVTVLAFTAVFLSLDIILIIANAPKVISGGWLPLGIALSILIIFYTWIRGQCFTNHARQLIEKPLQQYIVGLQKSKAGHPVRVPGRAVFIGHHIGKTPTALRTTIEEMHELAENVVIVYVQTSAAAHIPPAERASVDGLGYADGISQVVLTYGFHDTPNIPKTLASLRAISSELDFDPAEALYYISLSRVVTNQRSSMVGWQKGLFALMSRNALSASDYYGLPVGNTVELRTLIQI